jgi:hypothetical protein
MTIDLLIDLVRSLVRYMISDARYDEPFLVLEAQNHETDAHVTRLTGEAIEPALIR